jgi:hypothetical protein
MSVDEVVHMRDFGMGKEKEKVEDEDEITVISDGPEKRV